MTVLLTVVNGDALGDNIVKSLIHSISVLTVGKLKRFTSVS